jgi:hypothetical protein
LLVGSTVKAPPGKVMKPDVPGTEFEIGTRQCSAAAVTVGVTVVEGELAACVP